MKALREGLDRHQALKIEALRFSLKAVVFSYGRVVKATKEIEEHLAGLNFQTAFGLFVDAWSVIDSINRSREVQLQIKGLKRKTAWVEDFLGSTESVKGFRNILQHLATHIPRLTDRSRPIMGAYSWVDSRSPVQSHSICFSGSSQPYSVATLTVDTWESRFATNHVFSLDDRDLGLSSVTIACDNFSIGFEEWLESQGHLSDIDVGAELFNFSISEMRGGQR